MASGDIKAELAKRMKCHYSKKEKTYSFVFGDKLGLFIKVKNKEYTFSLTSEKKTLSKIKKSNIELKDGIKKLFDTVENIKHTPNEFPSSIMLFIKMISEEVKERKALFEWAQFVDPFFDTVKPDELPKPPLAAISSIFPNQPQPVINPNSFKNTACSIKKESKQENTSYGMHAINETTTGCEGTGWGKNYKKPK